MTGLTLSAETIDAIAERVADILRASGQGQTDLVDANEIARRYSVSTDYVYEHAEDLGAIRLGSGSKARLRFDPTQVAERLSPSSAKAPVEQSPSPLRRRRVPATEVDLLPIRGRR